jgi:GST-like protein
VEKITVLGCRGCGSAIAEAALVVAGIPYEREEIAYDQPGPGRDRLLSLNPLGQVPTLVFGDGTVLTETLAIIHWIHARQPSAGLVPSAAREPRQFLEFLRWSTFLVAAVYPTFTYGDDGAKWTAHGAEELRASTDAHRQRLLLLLENTAGDPWFLGETFSAIDLYISVMTHWRPRLAWFQEHARRLTEIAERVHDRAALRKVWEENFS